MLFENYIKGDRQAFADKVNDIAGRLGIPADWLMALMYFESRLDPQKVNAFGYSGLIQFGEAAAKDLGTTLEQIRAMDGVQQLELVYRFLYPKRKKMRTFADTYLCVLYPTAAGKPDDYRIGGETFARNNPIFDPDRDGRVTHGDVKRIINEWVETHTGRMLDDLTEDPAADEKKSPADGWRDYFRWRFSFDIH